MGDMAEGFKDMTAMSKSKRAHNRKSSKEILDRYEVSYTSHNGDAHFIVTHGTCVVDFWAGTGKWHFRKAGGKGRGVFQLLRRLGIEIED